MTATSAARPPFVALVVYTLRTCLPGRRWLGILLPCAAAVLFGLIVRGLSGSPTRAFAEVAVEALFGLVLPVTCLVVGDAVLGAERRAGTLTFTWMSPVPAWLIVVARWVGGAVVAAGCAAVAFGAAAVVAGVPEHAWPVAVAGAVGSMAYVAVFLAIGTLVRRAAAWSLAFVFIGERLVGEVITGIAQLSPAWVAANAYLGMAGGPRSLLRDGIPQGTSGLARLVVITAMALLLAAARFRHLSHSGSSD